MTVIANIAYVLKEGDIVWFSTQTVPMYIHANFPYGKDEKLKATYYLHCYDILVRYIGTVLQWGGYYTMHGRRPQ